MNDKLVEYFNGDEFAASTWENKYALKKNGEIIEETPDDMHRRMAKEFARIEKSYWMQKVFEKKYSDGFSGYYWQRKALDEERIYNLFKDFKYIVPAGSVMSGLGSEKPVSLSNCFVLPSPEDSYSSIMLTRLNQVELMKRRGGVGYDLSKLRPRGAEVNNAANTSTGAASFMDVNSDVTNEVSQNGRRGALMLSMNINHPDVEEFIEKKQDLTKVTGANVSVQITDEFMQAVTENAQYTLRWPVDCCINWELTNKANEGVDYEYGKLYPMIYTDNAVTSITKRGYMKIVKAKDIWDKIIHCAWNTAEPGIIFKGRMDKFSPDGVYDKYKGVSTNPCVTGDTKVAVADGRGYVAFAELAKEGKDVDVYCIDDNGNIVISKMVHPRITGYNEKIIEVSIENGFSLKCTPNHKLLTNNRGYVEAKDLKIGDSLFIMSKEQMTWDERYHSKVGKHNPYYFLSHTGCSSPKTEHRLIYEHYNPNDKNFEVVHHKDYNGLNNNPDNLEGMGAKEHIMLHRERMLGSRNPMVEISKNKERLDEYSRKMSIATSGTKNGNCKTNIEEYFKEAVLYAKSLGRNFYLKEWLKKCKKIGYPVIWDKFLQRNFGDFSTFSKNVAKKAGVRYIAKNGKILETCLIAEEMGYDYFLSKDEKIVYVRKKCEHCGKSFVKEWKNRETCFCSIKCATRYTAKHNDSYKKAMKDINARKSLIYNERNKKLIEYFIHNGGNDLKEIIKDFRKTTGIIYDIRAKLAFKDINSLVEASKNFNHKVIGIKEIGYDNVYNGTVEKYHNYFTGDFEETNKWGRPKVVSLNQKNCGEIFMSGCESCRLLAINMLSFVSEPFTENASIDVHKVYDITYEAMRLADDLVDLENEAVQRIIDVTSSDEYAQKVWKGILEKGRDGRRVGLEFTAMSDMIAALGKKFCTDEANNIIKNVCRLMMSASMDCQIDMAIERGHFPDWNGEIEKDNEWYSFIKEEFPERYELMKKFGRRNISFTTAGPTGSLSILTRTSSGIEPVFMPYYVRRRKCMSENDRVDYTDKMGVNFSEFVVVHPQLKTWASLNFKDFEVNEDLKQNQWEEIYKKSPWYGACAQDIDWKKRVELQGIVQKYLITHSISSTVNLPNDVTEQEVSDIYMEAWKHGLKGITVYRDGSREGIMLQKEKKKEDDKFKSYISAPKRPKMLPADFYVTRVKGETFFVMVGLYEEKPYEIFVYKTHDNEKTNYAQHRGSITKIKRGVYRYTSDLLTIGNINGELTLEEYATAVYSSMLLRHAAPLDCIIKTAQKVDDNIASFTAAMTRILKKYLKDEIIDGEVCPDCGGKLIRENGCIRCIDCGWSKCG